MSKTRWIDSNDLISNNLPEGAKDEIIDASQDLSYILAAAMIESSVISEIKDTRTKMAIMITALLRSVLAVTVVAINPKSHDDFFDSIADFLKHVAKDHVESLSASEEKEKENKFKFRTKRKEFDFL